MNMDNNIIENTDKNKADVNNFEDLKLDKDLIKGIYLYGYIHPSSIQIKGINIIRNKQDCIVQSPSGTGKTATYLLGAFSRLDKNNICQGIIITPTRELANQVFLVAKNLTKFTSIKITKCIGGTNIIENKNELKNTNLIIGTLGRLAFTLNDMKYIINKLKFIILDEADDLLNNGINPKLELLYDLVQNEKNPKFQKNIEGPTKIQTILISATITSNVFNFSKKYMYQPNKILLKNDEVILKLISQFYVDVEVEEQKFDTLLDLYNLVSTSQAIIFCNTIKKVEWLESNLKQNNFPITVIHSNMTMDERHNILEQFKIGNTRLLLTTDLLARGIDIPQVNMVINYDLPYNKETYVHRIGRCSRFDRKGIAINMVKTTDTNDLKIIHRLKTIYKINIKELPETLDEYL
jgi:superfamily II DNA/RNA helicase